MKRKDDFAYAEGTNDKVPVLEEEVYPDTYSDYTEESYEQQAEDIEEIVNKEAGLLTETELLEESPVYDDDLGFENLENDFAPDDFDRDRA